MRKKLLSCVLVMALVFSLIPAFSLTAAGAWTSAGGTVYASTLEEGAWLSLDSDTTLILDADVSLTTINGTAKSNGETYALTIKDSGGHKLTVINDDGNAIGVGSFTLESGTVEAVGTGVYTKGIFTDGGRIVINGGSVTAKGNYVGMSALYSDIVINGGTVIAEAGSESGASGIYTYQGGDVIINGGTVTATGGEIGIQAMGKNDKGGNVIVQNAAVYAQGGRLGLNSWNGLIDIRSGSVTAVGDAYGVYSWTYQSQTVGAVNVSGGTLMAKGNAGGIHCSDGKVTVTGGTVIAQGSISNRLDMSGYLPKPVVLVSRSDRSGANAAVWNGTDNLSSAGVFCYVKIFSYPLENPFVDVKESDSYYDAVLWAYYAKPQVTNGMDATHFGPTVTVTRAQAMTFLWRAMGRPEPKTATNPFTDVPSNEYYYKAVLWAVEKGITNGTTATTFAPNETLSTAHMITFLYRTLKPGKDGWYQEAADWSYDKNGKPFGVDLPVSNTTNCPRGAVVSFLYGCLDSMLPVNELSSDDFLMYAEDSYTITGRGPMITGRVLSGRVDVGDSLRFLTWDPKTGKPLEYTVTVSGIEMFRKSMSYAEKGDNIGILLDGIAKDQIQQGSALVDVGTAFQVTTGPVKGDLHVFSKDEGGRNASFSVNYHPQFYYGGAYDVTGTFTDLNGKTQCDPGKDYTGVTVGNLVCPVFWYVGQEISVREGGRTVGSFIVTEVTP